jgi:S1-C subfamily serine protease
VASPPAAIVVPRAFLDRGLSDFAALDEQVTLTQLPQGGFRIAALRQGSFLERMGLRAGDIILRVDGRPLNGVDDASAAYAWVRVTDRFTVEVVRAGRPLTLRYVVTA